MVGMRSRATALVVAATVAATLAPAGSVPAAAADDLPPFKYSVERVHKSDLPYSWHEGCPVGPKKLRLVRLRFVGFDGDPHMGRLVVHHNVVEDIVAVFRRMYRHEFKIHHMKKVDAYEGDDDKSMAADNTSAFNCRTVSGSSSWSMHAYGKAVDINPVENPYVRSDGSVEPPSGARYADRSIHHKGLIRPRGNVVEAFADRGWEWGGTWVNSKDYQHFSSNGK